MEEDNNKVDLMKMIFAHAECAYYSSKEVEIISNAFHDIVERALQLEDKSLLQTCEKLGLLENGQWRNLKS